MKKISVILDLIFSFVFGVIGGYGVYRYFTDLTMWHVGLLSGCCFVLSLIIYFSAVEDIKRKG